jgi:hypothetical protein
MLLDSGGILWRKKLKWKVVRKVKSREGVPGAGLGTRRPKNGLAADGDE